MKPKKKQTKKKIEIKEHKSDWIIYFAIIGWSGIVALWIWQGAKLLMVEDTNKGILYLVIALVFLFIGIKSTRDHIKKKKMQLKKK